VIVLVIDCVRERLCQSVSVLVSGGVREWLFSDCACEWVC